MQAAGGVTAFSRQRERLRQAEAAEVAAMEALLGELQVQTGGGPVPCRQSLLPLCDPLLSSLPHVGKCDSPLPFVHQDEDDEEGDLEDDFIVAATQVKAFCANIAYCRIMCDWVTVSELALCSRSSFLLHRLLSTRPTEFGT